MDYKLNVEKIRKEAELQFKELDKVLKKQINQYKI